ncbi:MAG: putative AGC family protein kinase, partial [Streblomastix strix]
MIGCFPFNTSWKKSDFYRKERLGKGGFGAVWLMEEKSTSLLVAVKEMDYYTEKEKKMVTSEITIMKNIYSKVQQSTSSSFIHVVQPLGFFLNEEEDKAFLVLEYCQKGDLRKYIENMKLSGTEISEQKCNQIIGELASTLKQLHSIGIIHSDLKPDNVLLTSEFKVKLADFGIARQLQFGREYITAQGVFIKVQKCYEITVKRNKMKIVP